MNDTTLRQFFTTLPQKHILVVGDLIVDKYIWGTVDRISPEAPVQVVSVNDEEIRAGGAGNVAHNLVSLGCSVTFASVIGNDTDGKEMLSRLNQKGVDTSAVQLSSARKTCIKTRVLAQRQQMLRIDRETTKPVSSAEMRLLFEQISALLTEVQAVIVSDYLKGVLTPELLKQTINACRRQNIPILIDPKGEDFSRYNGATVLTPNRRETEIATKIKIADETSLVTAGKQLKNDYHFGAVIITRSEEGMTLFSQNNEVHHFPTKAREVFDVSGAGDTLIATIGAVLAAGFSLGTAVKIGNIAAGVVVGKLGTSTVTPEEIASQYAQGKTAESKILHQKQLKKIVDIHRQRGETIVFTNGCFDLLHAGHVWYLQQARQRGDVLILGLNADTSIRRLKGEKRPLLAENERAQILSALDCISHIVIFEEDTPMKLLEIIRPDLLVKGGDYTADQVVGKEFVESYGGVVELISFVEGKSTTNIVDKILSRYRDT